jgi:GntR family transcriptional repressor for pyruvate dehydrogenase complex
MKLRLKPIRPKRISDQVFDQLREHIFRGELEPGQKIMTEREISEAMGVSRNSVREAINKLVTLGFLDQRQGQGTFVRSLDEAIQIPLAAVMETQDASLIDLLEVRMGIECNAAALAAQRAGDEDLETIEKAVADMATDTRAGGLGTDGDVSFHMAVATATHNPLQIYIMKNVADFLFVGIRENLLHLYEDPENIEKILAQHRAVYRTIRDRDSEAAYLAMKRHIDFVIAFFRDREERNGA